MQDEQVESIEQASVIESTGTNQVDVSADAIAAEWDRIVNDHEVGEVPKVEASGDGGLKFEKKVEAAPGDLDTGDKVAAAEMVIRGALAFVCESVAGLDIGNDKYDKVAKAWAVVIVKHFNGGIFEFIAKYKDELAAAAATLVFVKAVRVGIAEKKQNAVVKKEAEKNAGDASNS